MDAFDGPNKEKETYRGQGPSVLDGLWLAPFLLLCVRDGYANTDDLVEQLADLGLGGITPPRVSRALRQMNEEGLVEESPIVRDPVQGEGERYVLTLVGESHLDLWGVSLEEYGEEIGHFLRAYRGVWDGHREQATLFTGGTRRGGSGATFVLTSSGLRHMGLRPGHQDTGGRGFLGYPREEIFWKDAFELVHKDDLPILWFMVSLVMEEPGTSESVEVRFREAGGGWDLMDVSVLNVLEAPTGGDTGLIVVNVRHARIGAIEDVKMQNGKL